MGLEMRSVDHQCFRNARLRRQAGEYSIKHAQPAPADEAVIKRLVLTIFLWRVTPAKAIANNKNNSGKNPAIINAGNAMGKRKVRLYA